jgi:hypothetical protein
MLVIVIIGFLVIKAVFLLMFYFKQLPQPFLVVLFSSLAVVPLITILYHSTDINFMIVYIGIIALDSFLFYRLVQPNLLKAIPASFLMNTFSILLFFLVNG